MLKVLLFLYPCSHYIEPMEKEAKEHFSFFNLDDAGVEKCLDGINEELRKYRNSGYAIYFAVFSKGYQIEDELISSRIDIHPEDKLIPAGVSWGPDDKFQYPEPMFLLNQIEIPIEELVIGGFHRVDCCTKVLDAAKARGVNTRIDENLTDRFYE